jgi:hypothetical protein
MPDIKCKYKDVKNPKANIRNQKISRRSSGVEHFLGKEEVMGSNPIVGSTYNRIKVFKYKINLQ